MNRLSICAVCGETLISYRIFGFIPAWRHFINSDNPSEHVPVSIEELEDGEPCGHIGCLRHITHPCERCNRIGGKRR